MLGAYYRQDERERHLLSGDAKRAREAGAAALDEMARTYEVEFPWLDRSRARAAGEAFMHGLFVQDEIENWPVLRAVAGDDVLDTLVSDPGAYGPDLEDDGRWKWVEASLLRACREAGIDERYARRQTRFWQLHGQSDPEWERAALGAHELKLRALVENPSESAIERLGRRFVEGVRIHDESRLDEAVAVVTEYYDEIFTLRSGRR
ncbi:hypothetical protein HacjB3_09450 [Halalkalicoccus jeotgali B3]|uniref:Uncharacterized protein n=1 Tax=Halalkalicoccus jeotgali (strain DSM 18796 / CECT 7217 / JCM 14584 / KCTC 4019 / B3) TaxID=795797 RepID=D8J3G6_HALJB|nr:hypothetical protein HacjB3_09450 [Halalkalicoccus jeotgali B3]